MAALPVNYWSLAFIVLCICCYFIIMPTEAINVEGMKTDSKDGNGNSGGSINSYNTGAGSSYAARRSLRSIYGIGPKMLQISRSKIPIELDLLVENDDGDRSKRFDDYGHMRFGKRGGEEQFDDYGHMRFGRSV